MTVYMCIYIYIYICKFFLQVIESKMQKISEELLKQRKEKDQLQEELNEKDRQANSQDLVSTSRL